MAEQTDRVEVFIWPSGEDVFTRAQMNTSHNAIEDRVATFLKGLFEDRPTADATTDRMFYLATDSGIVYYSNSSNWFAINQFAAPVAQVPGDSNTEGVATTNARSDHKHQLPAWGTAIQSVATDGATSSAGATAEFARVDHVHALGSNAVTAGKIATGGISAASQFAAGVVNSAAIAANAVTRTKIAETERMPVGSIIQFGGSTAPSGWLLCDGSVYSQASYGDLYGVIQGAYNIGGESGSDFRLPDLRSRVPVGKGNMLNAGGTGQPDASSRIAGGVTNTLGGSGGEGTVTLSTTHLPSHAHGMTHNHTASTNDAGSHSHAPPAGAVNYVYSGFNSNAGLSFSSGGVLGGTTGTAGLHSHTVTVDNSAKTATDNEGSGTAHNNLQPYIVVNYIIKF